MKKTFVNNGIILIMAAASAILLSISARASDTNNPTESVRASEPDNSINREIFDILMANNLLAPGPNSVCLSTRDGVITISGNTPTLENKEQTDSAMAKLPGVRRVDDNRPTSTEVTTQQTPAESAVTRKKIDDTAITDEAKSSMMFHNSVNNVVTQIGTTNGAVTISGIAKSEAQKSRITKLATNISGVTSVINNMTIVMPAAAN